RCLLVLPLGDVHIAEIGIGAATLRVACNRLLIGLCSFVQFPAYTLVVISRNGQLFPFAGMLAQLECLGVIFAGASSLTHAVVIVAHIHIANGKVRVEFDGVLMVRQGGGCTFLRISL